MWIDPPALTSMMFHKHLDILYFSSVMFTEQSAWWDTALRWPWDLKLDRLQWYWWRLCSHWEIQLFIWSSHMMITCFKDKAFILQLRPTSRLDCCTSLWLGLQHPSLHRFQSVHSAAAGAKTPLQFGWFMFKICFYVCKCYFVFASNTSQLLFGPIAGVLHWITLYELLLRYFKEIRQHFKNTFCQRLNHFWL